MYKQGDIVTVHYPFSDNPKKSKIRPAVVVSNEQSNSLDNDVLICPVTTTVRLTPFSFPITEGDTVTPLPKNSEVRCNKVVTMRNYTIIGKYSELKPESLTGILEKVKNSF